MVLGMNDQWTSVVLGVTDQWTSVVLGVTDQWTFLAFLILATMEASFRVCFVFFSADLSACS